MTSSSTTLINSGTYGNVYKWHSVENNVVSDFVIKISRDSTAEKKKPLLTADFWLRYLHRDARASTCIVNRVGILRNPVKHLIGLHLEYMRYNLKQYLDLHENGLSLDQTRAITGKIAKALCFLDEKDVVYVNLSPENILVSEDGSEVKLGNFENVFFKQGIPFISYVKVNQSYASPEILLGTSSSALMEGSVWSLAVIAYELFTKVVLEKEKTKIMRWHESLIRSSYPISLLSKASDKSVEDYYLEGIIPDSLNPRDLILDVAKRKMESEQSLLVFNQFIDRVFLFDSRASFKDVVQGSFFQEAGIEIGLSNPKRYTCVKKEHAIGSGGFGEVFRGNLVDDNGTSIDVAIKRISKKYLLLNSVGSDMAELNSPLHEYSLLRLLSQDSRSKDVFVNCLAITRFRDETFLAFDLMDMDLSTYIRTKTITIIDVKAIASQILNGLVVLSDFDMIHADLKPANILISADGRQVKIADLGSCVFNESAWHVESYVCTRWYRAPEIALDLSNKKMSDMWSFGAILGELILKKPIFPAFSSRDLVRSHLLRLGKPYLDGLKMVLSNSGVGFYKKKLKNSSTHSFLFNEPGIKESGLSSILKAALCFNGVDRSSPRDLLNRLNELSVSENTRKRKREGVFEEEVDDVC